VDAPATNDVEPATGTVVAPDPARAADAAAEDEAQRDAS
jgi:hypothetical protein